MGTFVNTKKYVTIEELLELTNCSLEKTNKELKEWWSDIEKKEQEELNNFIKNDFPSILNNIEPSLQVEPYTFKTGLYGILVYNGNNEEIYNEIEAIIDGKR